MYYVERKSLVKSKHCDKQYREKKRSSLCKKNQEQEKNLSNGYVVMLDMNYKSAVNRKYSLFTFVI